MAVFLADPTQGADMKFHPRIRATTLALLASASSITLAQAETLTVTDITVEGEDGFKLVVPTVEATDANLDEAAIRALFTANFTDSAERLATLDAAAIRIPELTMTYDVANPRSGSSVPTTVTYRNVELSGVSGGIAESAALGEIAIAGVEDSVISIGRMSTEALDIGAILGFYGFGPATGGDEMKPVYRNFAVEGGSIKSPMLNCTIEGATVGEFSARPLKGTFTELMRYAAELDAAETSGAAPSPEALLAVVNYYTDLLTAFQSSPMEFGGFECSGTDGTGFSFNLSSGGANIGGYEPGIYPAITLNEFRMEVPDEGWFAFDNFTWKAMDLNAAIEAVTAAGSDISAAWFEQNWRKLIPAFEGLSLSGLRMDVPENGGRIVAGIGAFDVSLADYVNGIPSHISTSASGVTAALPQTAETAPLRALGIETLDLGFDLAAHWDEPTKTISIEKLALAGADLGGITLSATLANAGPELFSADEQVATVAAAALTVTELTIDIDNDGFVPLLIAAAAAEQNTPPEAFHVALSGMAQAMPLALLGPSPDSVKVGEAIGKFLRGAPGLSITLTAADPRGIGLAELMAAENDPSVLKDKVKVAATASGEIQPFTYPELPAPGEAIAPAPATPTPEAPATREQEKEMTKN